MEERDTMIKWKKLAATVVAAAAAVSCVGCGNLALAYPLTIDGVKIKAGITSTILIRLIPKQPAPFKNRILTWTPLMRKW